MTERRPTGALEQEVLLQLWTLGRPATPAEVLDELDDDLAYTTVMTILTRLWQKGLVVRTRQGRAFAYEPAVSEAELTARRMHESLSSASGSEGSTRDVRREPVSSAGACAPGAAEQGPRPAPRLTSWTTPRSWPSSSPQQLQERRSSCHSDYGPTSRLD